MGAVASPLGFSVRLFIGRIGQIGRISHCRIRPIRPISPIDNKYPRQESNLIPDLRRVVCDPPHSEDETRADGWIRTSMNRLTRPAPFYFEPHRQKKQERKDSNPVRRLWKPRALPGAHFLFQGVRGESNPPPRRS